MKKIVIFGNSGSGKSTLARKLAEREDLPHLDLDEVAWKPTTVSTNAAPERLPLSESKQIIDAFIQSHSQWVIEGCYSDLLELVVADASEMIFLNLPVEHCIANARKRPWEPHKYPSKAAQDANLNMLIDWIAQYDLRDDVFSKSAHMRLYARFQGKKTMYTENT